MYQPINVMFFGHLQIYETYSQYDKNINRIMWMKMWVATKKDVWFYKYIFMLFYYLLHRIVNKIVDIYFS